MSQPLTIWLITVGEPLPLTGNERLLRTGVLARELTARGHTVVWWTSRFDHTSKRYSVPDTAPRSPYPGLTLRFLDGGGYPKNISIARLNDHAKLGRLFAEQAPAVAAAAPPQVIVASMPTVELAHAATQLGLKLGVPTVLDIRDLWPDVFIDVAPKPLRPLARLLFGSYERTVRQAMAAATAVIACSPGYRDWGVVRSGRALNPDRDRVFPLGASRVPHTPEVSAGFNQLSQRIGLPANQPFALFAGAFGRTYDLSTVIEAARLLATDPDQSRPLAFVLAGAGETEAALKAHAAGLTQVCFTGWLQQPELAALLHHARYGLAAYRADAPQSWPNKPIEYMAYGLPVISSLSGEMSDLLAESGAGVTYPADSPTALAQLLRELQADPPRRQQLGAAGSARFERDFSAGFIYRQFADYLQTLALQPKN